MYGKCRAAALKNFVAYKHLPSTKPRVSLLKDKTHVEQIETLKQGQSNSKTTSINIEAQANPKRAINQAEPENLQKKKITPKKSPPQNIE